MDTTTQKCRYISRTLPVSVTVAKHTMITITAVVASVSTALLVVVIGLFVQRFKSNI